MWYYLGVKCKILEILHFYLFSLIIALPNWDICVILLVSFERVYF